MRPYSNDLRLRVLAAVDRGMPREEIARVFGVSAPTVRRYLKLRRETGGVEPKPVPGPPARKGAALEAALPTQAKANPDLTLEEHCELFEEAEGARWREGVGHLDPRLLVFVDECGTHTSMTRLRARAPKGQRAYGRVPRNRGKNTTLLASMGAERMGPCLAVEGATTKAVFEAYVERLLAPSLSPGQVVVLDNLGAHKGDRVKGLIEERGCWLLFLPPYSPDYSPIEEAFSKVKTLLRKAAARTRGALVEAMRRALDAVTAQDIRGWFGHCGYRLDAQSS